MNVLRFDSHAEMQAYLIQSQTDAHTALHPAQRAITFGTYWCRFVDVANSLVEFGRVAELHEVTELEIAAGSTAREAADVARKTAASLDAGFMYGIAYSVYEREGVWGHTHKAHVWPIEESLFHAAAEVNWQIALLPTSQKINLEVAFRAMRGHVRGEG